MLVPKNFTDFGGQAIVIKYSRGNTNVEWGWAVSSWRHEKRHDAKHPKHHVVDRSRHRVSACKILTDR